jgi:hypothetical protein
MLGFFIPLTVTLIIVIIVMAANLFCRNELFKRVKWVCSKDDNIRCNIAMVDWVLNVQSYSLKKQSDIFFPRGAKMFPIEASYRLTEEEREMAKKIICEYQQDMIATYFYDNLSSHISIYKLTEPEYFIYTLTEFLMKNQCKDMVAGQKMYDTLDFRNHGEYGRILYDATLQLTDFAVAYHKMLYIAQNYYLMFQKNPQDEDSWIYVATQNTKNVIDTKTIGVRNY